MADQQVSVVFTADASPMTAELRAAVNELKQLELALRKSTDVSEINKLNVQVGLLKDKIVTLGGASQDSFGKLNTSLKSASNQLNNTLKSGANNASFAVNDLNRVVQDLPYGFIGISNNINPLVESFSRLRASAALAGTTMRAELLATLAGPAGIALAIAAVTTAITFAEIGFSRWGASAKKAKEEVDKYKKELRSAEQGAIAQSIRFQSLIKIITDVTKSEKLRNDALNEANDILEPYGQKIDSINISNKTAKKLVDDLTESLVNQAVATKYADRLADLRIQKREKQNQIAQFELKNNRILTISSKELTDAGQGAIGMISAQADARNQLNSLKQDEIRIDSETIKLTNDYNAIVDTTVKTTKDRTKSTKSLNDVLAEFEKKLIAIQSVGVSLGTPQFEINKDKINEFESVLKKIIEDFNVKPTSKIYIDLAARLDALQFEQVQTNLKNMLRKAMKESDAIIESMKPVELPVIIKPQFNTEVLLEAERQGLIGRIESLSKQLGIAIPINLDVSSLENLKNTFKNLQDLVDKQKKEFSDRLLAVGQEVQSMAQDIGVLFAEAIGNAFSGQSFDFLGNLYDIIGSGLIKIGKILFVVAGLAEKVQTALSHIFDGPAGPFFAVTAGLAAIALGTAIKNFKTKNQFAVGTNYAPGGIALVGERGPEMVTLPRGAKVTPAAQTAQMMGGAMQQVEVFGVLRGQDIYFSNKKYSQTYRRTT